MTGVSEDTRCKKMTSTIALSLVQDAHHLRVRKSALLHQNPLVYNTEKILLPEPPQKWGCEKARNIDPNRRPIVTHEYQWFP